MKVLRKDEEDWWYARHSDGRCGSIPVPYIEIVSGGCRVVYRTHVSCVLCICRYQHNRGQQLPTHKC